MNPSKANSSNKLGRQISGLLLGFLLHVPICYKLSGKLFTSLIRGTWMWMIMLGRLLVFTIVLLPGWIGMLKYWFLSPNILRNVEYGLGARKRNMLDVYLPSLLGEADMPVVVFVTGGAWIIGYKLWCALIARKLSSMGILTIVPDYRNFPQGNVEDMVTDIVAAIAWASKNARSYGGDPHKLVLAGQSAGAHICMCALMDALKARMDSQGQKSRNSFMNIATPVVSGLPKCFREEDSSPFRSTGRKSDLRNGNPLVREYFVGKKSDVSSQRNIPSYDRTNNARTKTGTETYGGLTDDEERRRAACGHENEKHGQEHDGEEEEEETGDHGTTWKSSTRAGKKSDALNTNPTTKENASSTTTDSEALLSTDLGVISSPERFGFLDTLKSPTQMAMIPIQMGLAVMRKGRDYLDKVKSKVCETIAHLEGGEEYCRNEKRRSNNDAEEVDEMSCKTLELDAIKLFVGVSGPYNILSLSSHMQSRGLDHSILKWICKGDIARYSPTLHLDRIMKDAALSLSQSPLPLRTCAHPLSGDEKICWKSSRNGNKPISVKDDKSESLTDSKKLRLKIPDNIPSEIFNGIPPFKIINRNLTAENVTSEVEDRWSQSENEEEGDEEEENRRLTLSGLNFPPVVLYHGALDISVPSSVSVEMAATISRWGGEVYLRMYENWAHTDPILEGPLTGDNTLCEDIVAQIKRVFPATSPTLSSTLSFSNRQSNSPSPSTPLSCEGEKNAKSDSDADSGPGSLIRNVSSVSTEDLFPRNTVDKCPRCLLQVGASRIRFEEKNISEVVNIVYDSFNTETNYTSSAMRPEKDAVKEVVVDEHYTSRANVTYVTAFSILTGRDHGDDYLVGESQPSSHCCCVDEGVAVGVGVGVGRFDDLKEEEKVRQNERGYNEDCQQKKKTNTNSKTEQVSSDDEINNQNENARRDREKEREREREELLSSQFDELKRARRERCDLKDEKDDLSDCRVPSVMVAVARFVNPF